MAAKKNTQEIQSNTFEEKVSRLQEIVNTLEQGNVSLAESINLYKEGLSHTKQCRQELEKARHEIQILTDTSQSGEPDTKKHASSSENASFSTSASQWEDFVIEEEK